MSWQDRLAEDFQLTSPDGDKFVALWSGDSRKRKKKLGIFEFPGLVGATVQDLQVGASLYTEVFYFEGVDHDIEAERFFRATAQLGTWSVVHPTKGLKTWQLMSIEEKIQPIASANMTVFESEWIEPSESVFLTSTTEKAAEVTDRSGTLKTGAENQTGGMVDAETPSGLARFEAAVNVGVRKVEAALADITSTVASTNALMESISSAITSTLAEVSLDVLGLAGQVRALIVLPSLISGNLMTQLGHYGSLITSVVGLTDSERDAFTTNDAAVTELVAVVSLAAVADVAVLNPPTTREEAIEALTSVAGYFNSVITGLDLIPTKGYTSQSETFNDTVLLLASVSELILRRSFDLATSKKITLTRPRAPVEIAITEGVDLDPFIATNGLEAEEILLLPPGRVVTVYL